MPSASGGFHLALPFDSAEQAQSPAQASGAGSSSMPDMAAMQQLFAQMLQGAAQKGTKMVETPVIEEVEKKCELCGNNRHATKQCSHYAEARKAAKVAAEERIAKQAAKKAASAATAKE